MKLSVLRPLEEISKHKRHEILVLSTGSQGEARSSLLRLANDENSSLKIKSGDVVILSSRNIPGNERAISYVVNQLFRLGATVYYEDQKNIHVSGHAYQSEQLELLKLVKPRYFIPIHGEYRHLVIHSQTAKDFGIPDENAFVIENGEVWEFDSKKGARVSEQLVPSGRRWVFQESSGEMDALSIKERKISARAGIVVIECLTTSRATKLIDSPRVTLKGFLCSEEKQNSLVKSIQKVCVEFFDSWVESNSEGMTREQWMAVAARRVFKRELDIKPLIILNFLSV